jgi:hypothetical protein
MLVAQVTTEGCSDAGDKGSDEVWIGVQSGTPIYIPQCIDLERFTAAGCRELRAASDSPETIFVFHSNRLQGHHGGPAPDADPQSCWHPSIRASDSDMSDQRIWGPSRRSRGAAHDGNKWIGNQGAAV